MKRNWFWLWVWVGGLLWLCAPALAQEPPIHVDAVEPPQGQPGEELTLLIHGGGFGDARQVQVIIAGIEVREARIESDEAITAQILIPADAPPGPRPVEVVASFGPGEEFVAELAAGFSVIEAPFPPGPPQLYEVSPSQVARGSEAELTLIGENLTPETTVIIGGEGVEVYDWTMVDASRLIVHVGVHPDAAPGPRLVVVETAAGLAELPGGLIVAEEAPLPGPTPTTEPTPVPSTGTGGGDGGSLVLLSGGALLVWTLGFVVGRALTLRSRLTWQQLALWQWQLEASTRLPEPKKACTWTCKADASTDLLKRWQVTTLRLTPLPVAGGKTPPARQVSGKALTPLNEAARIEHLLEDEEHIRRRIAPVAQALLREILAWGEAGQSPAAIRLDVRLAREIKWGFRLYHCRAKGQNLVWKEMKKWKGALHQPGGRFLGVLQGPRADEEDFARRAQTEIEALLLQLVKGVRFKL